MSAPQVSVLMPVYNAANYLREAVASVLAQSYQELELICMDDASTDDSLRVLREFQDPRIKILTHADNQGIVSSLNDMIGHAKGRYLARMDADDVCHPERIRLQVEYLEQHTEAAAVFAFVEQIDHYGASIGPWKEDRAAVSPNEIRDMMPRTNCLAHPTAMIRAEVFKSYRYQEALKVSEDWGLWLELLADGLALHKLPVPLVRYRIHPTSFTASNNQGKKAASKTLRFRAAYLAYRKSVGKYNGYDHRVRNQLWADRLYRPVERALRKLFQATGRIIRANPLRLISDLVLLSIRLFSIRKTGNLYFFPFHHVGGAERVHCEIVYATANPRSLVFITKISGREGYLAELGKNAQVIDIGRLCSYPVFRNLTASLVSGFLHRIPRTVLFGSNSVFYYQMLGRLRQPHYCIDLIHAFVHANETGAEHWSLPVASRLNKRVFVSRYAMEQMRALYAKHGLAAQLLDRFVFIPNSTYLPAMLPPRPWEPFTVAYIGRGTSEKRVHLAGSIANSLKREVPGIRFLMVGDLEEAVLPEDRDACEFVGVLTSPEAMRNLLEKIHVLILTSSREGMPLAVMEGMAFGAVPVVTAVGDLPQVLSDGVDGFLFPPEEPAALTEAMVARIKELWQDRARWDRMSSAAFSNAAVSFNHGRFVHAYQAVFNEERHD